MMDYETIAIILAISGQYIFLIKVYSEMQKLTFEFSLCPHHKTTEQIVQARKDAAKNELELMRKYFEGNNK